MRRRKPPDGSHVGVLFNVKSISFSLIYSPSEVNFLKTKQNISALFSTTAESEYFCSWNELYWKSRGIQVEQEDSHKELLTCSSPNQTEHCPVSHIVAWHTHIYMYIYSFRLVDELLNLIFQKWWKTVAATDCQLPQSSFFMYLLLGLSCCCSLFPLLATPEKVTV